MKMATRARLLAWPWSGFLLGGLGLVLTHQIGSDRNNDMCGAHGWPEIWLTGLIGLGLAAAGAFLSWQLWRRGEHHESATRRFIAAVSMGAAAIFSFAMLLPLIASTLIPRCYG